MPINILQLWIEAGIFAEQDRIQRIRCENAFEAHKHIRSAAIAQPTNLLVAAHGREFWVNQRSNRLLRRDQIHNCFDIQFT
jgi:hypothetical protein